MNYENRNKLVALVYGGSAVSAVGYFTFKYVKTVREERAKRRKIAADLQRSFAVSRPAHERVAKRFMEGGYDKSSNPIYDMLMDLQFEQIVEYNKRK